MENGPRDSGFLPPEAPGPEPDLGETDQPQQPHQDTTQQLPQHDTTQQLPHTQAPPYAQPPPPQGTPPPHPGWGQPQGHGYGPPPGWQGQPPGGWQQPGWQGQQQQAWPGHQQQGWQGHPQQAWPGQQPWQPQAAWATGPKEPDNSPAVAGFALSLIGGGLLFFFAGLTTIISLGLSIAGIVYSRKGRAMVDEGKTSKQRGLAQAGFIIGIVSTVLSVLATVFWILFFVLLATSEEFRRDLEDSNFGEGNTISWELSIRVARAALALLS